MNSTRISFKDFMEQTSELETQRENKSHPTNNKTNKIPQKFQQSLSKATESTRIIQKKPANKKEQIHNVSIQIRKTDTQKSKQKNKNHGISQKKNKSSQKRSYNHHSYQQKSKSSISRDSQFLEEVVYALDKTIKNRPNKATSYLNKNISYIQYLQCLKIIYMISDFYEPNTNSTDIVSKFWIQHISKHTIKKFVQKISLISGVIPPSNKQEQQMIIFYQPLKKNRQAKLFSYELKERNYESINHSSSSYDNNQEVLENFINHPTISVATFEKQGISYYQPQDIYGLQQNDNTHPIRTSYTQNKSINKLLEKNIILFERGKQEKGKQNQNCMINMSGIRNFQFASISNQITPKQHKCIFDGFKSPVYRAKGIQQQFLSTISKQNINRNAAGNIRSQKLYQIAKSKSKNKLQSDKSTDQIQYQKNKNQLTFQPFVNRSAEKKVAKKQKKKQISRAQQASVIRMIKGRIERQIRKQIIDKKIPFDQKVIESLRNKKLLQYYRKQNNEESCQSNQNNKSIKDESTTQSQNQQQGIVIQILLNDRSQNLIFNFKRQTYQTAAKKFIQKHNLSQSFYLEKLIEGIKKAEQYCITKIQEQLQDAEESELF